MKLSARVEITNPVHTRITVFQDGGNAGVLTVDTKVAAKVLAILNGEDDLLAACEHYAECGDGCTCGDGWGHDVALAAIAKYEGEN